VEEELRLAGRGFGQEAGPFIGAQMKRPEDGLVGDPRVVPCGHHRGGQRVNSAACEESTEWVSQSAYAGGSICCVKACQSASCPPGFTWHAAHSTNDDDATVAEAGRARNGQGSSKRQDYQCAGEGGQ
jgi:hypothetical protein